MYCSPLGSGEGVGIRTILLLRRSWTSPATCGALLLCLRSLSDGDWGLM